MTTIRRRLHLTPISVVPATLLLAILVYLPFRLSPSVHLLSSVLQGCSPQFVSGCVTDAHTGDPIPEVVLIFGDDEAVSVTSSDAQGQYFGRMTGWVLLIKAGYRTRFMDRHETDSPNFTLQPDPEPLPTSNIKETDDV